ncbi:unnamed protein product [Rotaria sordida]|uniref:Hedgehog protein Hint domain-containing protein n=1 Tax=Rotaria sordida TaxID=392033 RepID=A0A815K006_9BILA|nr:unnamed protein product [Rotaria sordida]
MLLFGCINSRNHSYYESTYNCTSISSNSNVCLQYTYVTIKREAKCFPDGSIVITENGLMKSLSNIKIGERVLVINNRNKLIYEPIEVLGVDRPATSAYLFMHVS